MTAFKKPNPSADLPSKEAEIRALGRILVALIADLTDRSKETDKKPKSRR